MRPQGYSPGDWLATCYRCGCIQRASTMRKQWQGFWVCAEHWEGRHPQDFVKATRDDQTVPWSQPPPEDIDVAFCTFNGQSAMPGYAIGGCMIPSRTQIDPDVESPTVPALCDIYEVQGVPGWAGPGCSIPGFDPFAA